MIRYLAIAIALLIGTNALTGAMLAGAYKTIGRQEVNLRENRAALAAAAATLKSYADDADRSWSALEQACKTNAAAAQRAGRAIERIIHAPSSPSDAGGLVGAGELRDVAGQTAAGALPVGRQGGEPRP